MTLIAVVVLLAAACSSDSESASVNQGDAYGSNVELDALYDLCGTGDGDACESLFWAAPADTDYEAFAVSCGGTRDDAPKPARCGVETETDADVVTGDDGDTAGDGDYGSDPALDALWDSCEAGDGQACDDLFFDSPVGSEYENFGSTCGLRFALGNGPLFCAGEIDGGSDDGGSAGNGSAGLDANNDSSDDNNGDGSGLVSEPFGYGDDPDFDLLWDLCAAEDFEACDNLYLTSPAGSDYELFGGTCAERYARDESPLSCNAALGGGTDGSVFTYGDDPIFDLLWDRCEAGDGEACDELFYGSPVGSEYEAFGNTCGYRFDESNVPFSCIGET